MHKKIIRSAAVILCISLLTVSVFGASDYTTHTYTNLKFKSLDNYAHSVNGEYFIIDPTEFLQYVTIAYGKNQDFMTYYEGSPYSVQNVEFNLPSTTEEYMVLCFAYGQYNLRSEWRNHGIITVDGYAFDTDNNGAVLFNSGHAFFDHYKTVNNVGGNNTVNFAVACNDNDIVIACEVGNDYTMQKIIQNLNSITSTCNSLSTYLPQFNTLYQNILQGIVNENTNLVSINTSLGNIYNILDYVAGYCYVLMENTESIIDNQETMQDYFEQYFPTFDSDLYDIWYRLGSFKSSFEEYAQDALSYLQSIDNSTQHIDDTLSDIFDQMNGTALENVTVPNSSSPNLWQLIKSSVSTGLNGFGSLFQLIFNSITQFAGNALSAFGLFGNSDASISNYSPFAYSPTDLVNPPEPEPVETNILKPFLAINISNGSNFRVTTNYESSIPISYNLYSNGSLTGISDGRIKTGITLEAGTYKIYRLNSNNSVYYTIFKTSGGARIKDSPHTGTTQYSTFTLASTTVCFVNLYCDRSRTYDIQGVIPKIEKVD